ncbi:MAG: DEAD/DEAH box helicase [Gemmatimonadota bacterium]|nr:DEAD/DEAH box helicase [Gemmatimonadota bacterium]
MDRRLRLTGAAEVRARIARLILGDVAVDSKIGAISLQPHQLSAVARIEGALEEFGGALLCDEVGMGKTFVALAVARPYSRRLVVAPASLSRMWSQALEATGIDAEFVSFEKLSRNHSTIDHDPRGVTGRASRLDSASSFDLLIVDEAHHARNPATRRYSRLKELARNAKLLLLTANPVHNRRDDMSSVLALYLGSRANALTAGELARCVVRRDHEYVTTNALIPRILPTKAVQISDDPEIVQQLMNFPPPIPLRDGGLGRSLIGRGLVHQWASSEAALKEALRRRIARSFALVASLEAGTYPTGQELRTWIFDDGALQLGFPELLSPPSRDAGPLLESVRRHSDALQRFVAVHSVRSSLDMERADFVLSLLAKRSGTKIVAFAQYAETVSMLFRVLARVGNVAMLTSHGARVAGGRLSRLEALARFAPRASRAPPPPTAEVIDLLLSTDLLSEGVNLQDAAVVVHLDIPWTAARLEQRVGRVARMGSAHSAIAVYMIRPPATAAKLIENEILVQKKWQLARREVGSATAPPFPDHSSDETDVDSVARQTETLRGLLAEWRQIDVSSKDLCAAAIASPQSGFFAAASIDGEATLIVSLSGRLSTALKLQIAACRLADGFDVHAERAAYEAALHQIQEWYDRESASAVAGVATSNSMPRRRLVSRIDAAIENAPLHIRSRRLVTAAKARNVATAFHSAAIEGELESLALAQLSDDEWLAAIARLDGGQSKPPKNRGTASGLQIRALLLLITRARQEAAGAPSAWPGGC